MIILCRAYEHLTCCRPVIQRLIDFCLGSSHDFSSTHTSTQITSTNVSDSSLELNDVPFVSQDV